MSDVIYLRIVALLGALGVILGALGAHGPVHDTLMTNQLRDRWETAVMYHLIHTIAMFVIVRGVQFAPVSYWLFFAGIVLFSGSLYVLAYTGIKILGAITPIGGLCLIVGWVWLGITARGPLL